MLNYSGEPARDGVTTSRGKLYQKHNKLHSEPKAISVTKTKTMGWAGRVSIVGAMRNVLKHFVGTCGGK